MAGAPEKEKTEPLRIAVSARLRAYLDYLSRHTILGKSDSDVARYLLTQRLEEMIRTRYHETEIPPADTTS